MGEPEVAEFLTHLARAGTWLRRPKTRH
jgi:hypothetical protein